MYFDLYFTCGKWKVTWRGETDIESQLSETGHQNYTHIRSFQQNKLSQERIGILSPKHNHCSTLKLRRITITVFQKKIFKKILFDMKFKKRK